MENNNVVDLVSARVSADMKRAGKELRGGSVPIPPAAIAEVTRTVIHLMLAMAEQQDISTMPAGRVLAALAKSLAETLPAARP